MKLTDKGFQNCSKTRFSKNHIIYNDFEQFFQPFKRWQTHSGLWLSRVKHFRPVNPPRFEFLGCFGVRRKNGWNHIFSVKPFMVYPLVNVYITMERSTILQLGKSTISTGPFSIANRNKLPEGSFLSLFHLKFIFFMYPLDIPSTIAIPRKVYCHGLFHPHCTQPDFLDIFWVLELKCCKKELR